MSFRLSSLCHALFSLSSLSPLPSSSLLSLLFFSRTIMGGHSRNCTTTKHTCIFICVCPAHTDAQTPNHLKSTFVLSSFPQDSSRLALKHSMGKIKRLFGGIVVQVLTRFLSNFVFVQGFFFISVFSFPLFPSPPSRSRASVCRSQHAHACAFKTSPCVQAKRPHALNILPVHTGTF